jgi:hypothetical protein
MAMGEYAVEFYVSRIEHLAPHSALDKTSRGGWEAHLDSLRSKGDCGPIRFHVETV